MTLTYKVVSKRNTISPEGERLYYPALTDRKLADLRMVMDEIHRSSSVNPADVLAVMEGFRITMLHLLKAGYNVKIDELGTFSLHASSKGKADPSQVNHRDISKLSLSFLPSKEIKHQINQFKVRKKKYNS